MRRVILDTETTGLDWRTGDRIIEIGGIELDDRHVTGNRFHAWLNPERNVDADALAVHGLTNEFLADKPPFADIADEFIAFIRGAELVIHNADFDTGFLNNELRLLQRPPIETVCKGVTDSLRMARDLRPGKKNNLNALCSEFGINNSSRQLHGALLDAELLTEVYLSMTRGQHSFDLAPSAASQDARALHIAHRQPLMVLPATEAELMEHEAILNAIEKENVGRKTIWRQIEETAAPKSMRSQRP